MSYKIGLLLSMVFVSLCFLFGADLITIQSVYSTLDAKANNISYLISRAGVVDQSFIDNVQSAYHVKLECPIILSPTFGEEIAYTISTEYSPMVIAKEKMIIAISRVTVVGFYG